MITIYHFLLSSANMSDIFLKTFFEADLADETHPEKFISKPQAEQLFTFFRDCTLFKWNDSNNNCEARADAACLLLDEWKIPNYKGWVFGGSFLKQNFGNLINFWNYHVAALIPVQEDGVINFYIIDPATSNVLISLQNWADNITYYGPSYYFIREADYYIFPVGKIKREKWNRRNKQNQKWTMQGLSCINGLTYIGKAELCFKKNKIKRTIKRFRALKLQNPLTQNQVVITNQ